MSFKEFDTSKLDEYKAAARESWGKTPAWAEYEQKWEGRAKEEEAAVGEGLMQLFIPFGQMAAEGTDPASREAQEQISAIQSYITEHFYTCTDEIMAGLGHAYGSGGDFTHNINAVAGPGAAEFAAAAIEARFK